MEIETGFPAAEVERNSLGTCEIESPFEEPEKRRESSPLEVVEITKEYEHLHIHDDRITSDSDSSEYEHLHMDDDQVTTDSDSSESDTDDDMVSHHNEYDFGEPLMSKEDWAVYRAQIRESEGFEADLFKGGYEWEEPFNGVIAPVSLEEYEEEFKQFVEFAIEKQGKTNKIVLERIVKGNLQVLAPCIYYITFEAKDMDDDHHIKTYQTKVVLQFPEEDSYVKIFREKPAQC